VNSLTVRARRHHARGRSRDKDHVAHSLTSLSTAVRRSPISLRKRSGANAAAPLAVVEAERLEALDRRAEPLDAGVVVEDAGHAVLHTVTGATLAVGDHGDAGRLRLHQHDSEVLLAREEQGTGAGEHARNGAVVQTAQEFGAGAGRGRQPGLAPPAAHDLHPPAEPGARGHREVGSLVRDEPTQEQVVPAVLAG
jgi:hypothetical protein